MIIHILMYGLTMVINILSEEYSMVKEGQCVLRLHHFFKKFFPSLPSHQLFSAMSLSTSVSELMRTIPIQSHINPKTCTTSDLRPVNVVTVARAHRFTAANLVVQPYIILTFHVK